MADSVAYKFDADSSGFESAMSRMTIARKKQIAEEVAGIRKLGENEEEYNKRRVERSKAAIQQKIDDEKKGAAIVAAIQAQLARQSESQEKSRASFVADVDRHLTQQRQLELEKQRQAKADAIERIKQLDRLAAQSAEQAAMAETAAQVKAQQQQITSENEALQLRRQLRSRGTVDFSTERMRLVQEEFAREAAAVRAGYASVASAHRQGQAQTGAMGGFGGAPGSATLGQGRTRRHSPFVAEAQGARDSRTAIFQLTSAAQDASYAFDQMGNTTQAWSMAMRGASNNIGFMLSAMGGWVAILGTIGVIALPSVVRGVMNLFDSTEKLRKESEKYIESSRRVANVMNEERAATLQLAEARRALQLSLLPAGGPGEAEHTKRTTEAQTFRETMRTSGRHGDLEKRVTDEETRASSQEARGKQSALNREVEAEYQKNLKQYFRVKDGRIEEFKGSQFLLQRTKAIEAGLIKPTGKRLTPEEQAEQREIVKQFSIKQAREQAEREFKERINTADTEVRRAEDKGREHAQRRLQKIYESGGTIGLPDEFTDIREQAEGEAAHRMNESEKNASRINRERQLRESRIKYLERRQKSLSKEAEEIEQEEKLLPKGARRRAMAASREEIAVQQKGVSEELERIRQAQEKSQEDLKPLWEELLHIQRQQLEIWQNAPFGTVEGRGVQRN
jgi:hypothetical protein